MARPTLYVAITNHGFGHATRTAAVIAQVQTLLPDVRLIFATAAPQWLIAEYLSGDFVYRPQVFDIGVIQHDSLHMDKAATLSQLQQIQAKQDDLIRSEAAYLKAQGVQLVFGDIPPLVTRIAHAADRPCWMMGNFGWDFIYRPWGGEFSAIADWMSDCFQACDRLFRLPFHEPMSAFPVIEDVGLTGGVPQYSPDFLRAQWNLSAPPEKTVLLTFGGLGLQQVPYARLADFPDWQFLVFDDQAPSLPNLFNVPREGFRPVDVMPLCSRILAKPGYSTFAEACSLDLPVITLPRDDFAEGPILIEGIQDFAYHQILTQEAFFAGDWQFLHRPLNPPRQAQPLPKDGNQQIAEAIVAYLVRQG